MAGILFFVLFIMLCFAIISGGLRIFSACFMSIGGLSTLAQGAGSPYADAKITNDSNTVKNICLNADGLCFQLCKNEKFYNFRFKTVPRGHFGVKSQRSLGLCTTYDGWPIVQKVKRSRHKVKIFYRVSGLYIDFSENDGVVTVTISQHADSNPDTYRHTTSLILSD